MIANATGCSSIWGASAPSMPYCTDQKGRGPVWGNSLFEDNAEYGYGMLLAVRQMREKIESNMRALLALDIDENLREAFKEWLEYKDDGKESRLKSDKVLEAITEMHSADNVIISLCQRIVDLKDYLVKKSIWAVGGDGCVYVAQVGMGADKQQLMQAITEAEAYDGPSLIIAYAPCINHGLKKGMGKSQRNIKDAVACGYWNLYRYNPLLKEKGQNPFTLDSVEPTESFRDFIMDQVRYASLAKEFPDTAEKLFEKTEADARERFADYKKLAERQ